MCDKFLLCNNVFIKISQNAQSTNSICAIYEGGECQTMTGIILYLFHNYILYPYPPHRYCTNYTTG